MKKIKQVNKLTKMAKIDILIDAFGPKCLVTISIVKNDSQETNIPPSIARISFWNNVLFANRFIAITEITKRATTGDGMLLSNILVNLVSRLTKPEIGLDIKKFSLVLFC